MNKKMELLWNYQELDLELYKREKSYEKNENIVNFKKSRDFLINQKKLMQSIADEVENMEDRSKILDEYIKNCDEKVASFKEKFEGNMPEAMDTAKEFMKEAKKISKDIFELDKELKNIKRKSMEKDKQFHDIKITYARVIKEYEQYKKSAEIDIAKYKEDLSELTSKLKKLEEKIDPELLQKYKSIRKHIMPPLAKLNNNQCGGCDMALPAVTLSEFDSEKEYVECSNCGRMIIR